jgi:hypothetical protein
MEVVYNAGLGAVVGVGYHIAATLEVDLLLSSESPDQGAACEGDRFSSYLFGGLAGCG